MMDRKKIQGSEIELAVVEPWDFEPITNQATIVDWNDNTGFAIVKLITEATYKGQKCVFFRMKPRQGNQSLKELASENSIDCNLILLDGFPSQNGGSDFLDGWKNNIGLIASVRMMSKPN